MKTLALVSLLFLGACAAGLPKSGATPGSFGMVEVIQAQYEGGAAERPKAGKACSRSFLGLVSLGDAGVEAAKRAGGITNVQEINREIFGFTLYLPIYAKSCTVIRGS